MSMVCLL